MYYKAVKENDGTYTIRESAYGLNYTIIMTGVRGCNVNRIIAKLHFNDLFPEDVKTNKQDYHITRKV